MRPDTAIFDRHVGEAVFQAATDRQEWGIHNPDPHYSQWPTVIIWVKAAAKAGWPDRFYFRFDLAGYPAQAPTACPWDVANNRRLDSARWPRGNSLVSRTFNHGWNQNALYTPCDRVAMAGHDAWRTQFPDLWWQPDFKITVYLHFLFNLLNSSDYARS